MKNNNWLLHIMSLALSILLLQNFLILKRVDHMKIPPAQNTTITKTYSCQEKPESLICNVSAYTNHPNETNKDNNNTAIMEKPVAGKTCAVSQDLIHWLGGTVYIKGIGIRKVNDLMHNRFSKSIDIVMGSKKEAYAFGRNELTVIFLGR